jgi:ribosome-binding factor A
MRRVNEAVKELLAEAIPDLKDPRVGFVTLTEVRTDADLRRAEVFFTVLPDDDDTLRQTRAGLASAAPLLRRQLGAQLRLKRIPELRFSHDPVPARGLRIAQLLAAERDAQLDSTGHDDR